MYYGGLENREWRLQCILRALPDWSVRVTWRRSLDQKEIKITFTAWRETINRFQKIIMGHGESFSYIILSWDNASATKKKSQLVSGNLFRHVGFPWCNVDQKALLLVCHFVLMFVASVNTLALMLVCVSFFFRLNNIFDTVEPRLIRTPKRPT